MTTQTFNHWKLEVDSDHILWLTIDRQNSAVNSLSRDVLTEFDQILDKITADKSLVAVIIRSGKSSGFIAGADIEQFVTLKDEEQAFDLVRHAQLIFDKLAALKIPTIAMIQGFCLGGGLEFVLACRYRVVEDGPKTTLGAPEVNLGLHPGFGGTVRLPQLIGVIPAMEMNLTGRPVNAKTAAKLGLADVAVPERDLARAARYYALHTPRKHSAPLLQEILSYKLLRGLVARKLYQELAKKVSREHYPAPYAIVDNWLKDGAKGEAAMVQEARSIAKLLVGDTSRNLVRLFFLQTRLKGLAKGERFSPQHVHVVGAGVMGGDIAAWCALRGMRVTLQDRLPELISPAIKRAHELFEKKLKIPRLIQAALDRLVPDPAGAGVAKADVVIEAVSENLAIKQSLYQILEPQLKPGAILATNTSSLPLDVLSQVLKNAGRLVGIHFFNPVAKMQLVEVVQSEQTDAKVFNQAMAFVRVLDKLPLPVKSSPGFLVNRLLTPYFMEAMALWDEGISPADIDKAAVQFGMPMGPIELADVVGLDVLLSVSQIMSHDSGIIISAGLKQKVAEGNLGRKTGQGFYRYKQGKVVKESDGQQTHAAANLSDIADRLVLPLLNEAVACVREKIVADSDLLDAGMVFGTGFAPFRGGPIHYAKSRGITEVVEKLKVLASQYGKRFNPDPGWESLN